MPEASSDRKTGPLWLEMRRPCPICGHAGQCCISPDGAVVACYRKAVGAFRERTGSDGRECWYHRVRDRRDYGPSASLPPTARPKPTAAADVDLDRVYRALLACPELRLRAEHRGQLLARGLAGEDLDREGYRSLPPSCRAGVLRRLHDHYSDALLLSVPGVICRDGPHGRYLTLAGSAGLLVPVRSVAGHVVGLVVRPDDPGTGGKYRWLSSQRYGGPSSGARVHVPAGVGPAPSVRLVEGALNAAVAYAIGGEALVGLPGLNVNDEAIATLKALGAREALLALDADVQTNPHVARAQADGLRRLERAGFEYGIVRWDPELGKGYDDLLLTLRKGAV